MSGVTPSHRPPPPPNPAVPDTTERLAPCSCWAGRVLGASPPLLCLIGQFLPMASRRSILNGRVAVGGDSEQSGKFRTAAVICMILLALIGVALATAQSSIAFRYWVLLVPIYGLISVGSAWYQEHEGSRWGMVTRQALHWGAVMGVVGIDFYVRQGGAETTSAAGLSSLLLLG